MFILTQEREGGPYRLVKEMDGIQNIKYGSLDDSQTERKFWEGVKEAKIPICMTNLSG